MDSKNSGDNFYILSIDGGGFRGVFAAHILQKMEKEFQIKSWSEQFDLFAGTSTGAIIAAGLACNKSASEISQLYRDLGERIFKKRFLCQKFLFFGWLSYFMSPYKSTQLKKELDKIFGDKKLKELQNKHLIIPAVDIANGDVHVFKTCYDKDFVRDPDVCIADAVLASCSAPTYFDPHRVKEYMLADGGLWANNPALVAVLDAKYRLKFMLDKIKVLSIGTGEIQTFYPMKKTIWNCIGGWGFLTRWKRSQFMELILSLQSLASENMLSFLLPQENIMRINFQSNVKVPLDDPSIVDDLIAKADKIFIDQSSKIRKFIKNEQNGPYRKNEHVTGTN